MFDFVFDIVNKVVDTVVDAFTTNNNTNKTNNNTAGRTQKPGSNVTTSNNTNRGTSTPSSNNKPTNTTSTNTSTNKTNNNVAGRTHVPGSNVTTSTNTNRGTSTPNSNKGTSTNKTNTNTFGGTKIQNTVMLNKKEYDVYKMDDGTYYIIKDGQKKQLYGGMKLFAELQNEDPLCVDITDENLVDGGKTTVTTAPNTSNGGTGSTGSGTKPSTTPATGGSTSTRAPSSSTNTNTTTTKTETPVEKPVYEGAEAVAKRHNIDYNLANILADYDQRTNDYYDATTAEYEGDRTRYVQASNNYANRIMEEYLDSYANAAATASGRGTQAAAALITDLNTQAEVAANDLGMLQTVNNLNEARKAELVNNKFLAEQYYNQLGTYLSQVSTAQYGADVNKYVKEMDAYAQRYAADRALAENEARAASVKYAGLANANLYKSQSASSTAAWQRLYNYYLTRYNGNEQMAANAVNQNLGVNGGAN
jgi:hypothetical protein